MHGFKRSQCSRDLERAKKRASKKPAFFVPKAGRKSRFHYVINPNFVFWKDVDDDEAVKILMRHCLVQLKGGLMDGRYRAVGFAPTLVEFTGNLEVGAIQHRGHIDGIIAFDGPVFLDLKLIRRRVNECFGRPTHMDVKVLFDALSAARVYSRKEQKESLV